MAWLALAEDRPRYGEWYALARRGPAVGRAVLVGAPRARRSPSPGGGGSSPCRIAMCCCSSWSSWAPGSGWCARWRTAGVDPSPGHEPFGRRHLGLEVDAAVSVSAASGSQTRTSWCVPRSSRRSAPCSACDDVPARDDHELLGVARAEFVAPGVAERSGHGARGAAQRADRAGWPRARPRRWRPGRSQARRSRAGSSTAWPSQPG